MNKTSVTPKEQICTGLYVLFIHCTNYLKEVYQMNAQC